MAEKKTISFDFGVAPNGVSIPDGVQVVDSCNVESLPDGAGVRSRRGCTVVNDLSPHIQENANSILINIQIPNYTKTSSILCAIVENEDTQSLFNAMATSSSLLTKVEAEETNKLMSSIGRVSKTLFHSLALSTQESVRNFMDYTVSGRPVYLDYRVIDGNYYVKCYKTEYQLSKGYRVCSLTSNVKYDPDKKPLERNWSTLTNPVYYIEVKTTAILKQNMYFDYWIGFDCDAIPTPTPSVDVSDGYYPIKSYGQKTFNPKFTEDYRTSVVVYTGSGERVSSFGFKGRGFIAAGESFAKLYFPLPTFRNASIFKYIKFDIKPEIPFDDTETYRKLHDANNCFTGVFEE